MPAGFGSWMLGPDGGSSSSFLPTSIAGMTLWLEGSTGITTSASSPYFTWADQSGNGNSMTQTNSSSTAPTTGGTINGLAAITFVASSSQSLVQSNGSLLSASGACTMFSVWLYTGSVQYVRGGGDGFTYPCIFSCGSAGALISMCAAQDSSSTSDVDAITSTGNGGGTDAYVLGGAETSPHMSMLQINGTTQSAQIDWGTIDNGTAGSTPGAEASGKVGYNAASTQTYWNGKIGEILVYNKVLTTSQMSQIQTYLTNKWGFS